MASRVLVVDDSKMMRKMLQDIFLKNGYEIVSEAENGAEAIQKYKELTPDLVMMDVIMPELIGIDAVRAILAFDPKAKIVMCTALDHKELIDDAIAAGAKDYIVKPFKPEQVIQIAKKVLSRK